MLATLEPDQHRCPVRGAVAPADTEPAGTEPAGTEPTGGTEGVLSGICPDVVTIQTDWNPEAEHGWIYEMVGDDPVVLFRHVPIPRPKARFHVGRRHPQLGAD